MADEEVLLTKEGLAKLEDELKDLKTVKRREMATRLKVAISYGDLKENSEYHSAKEEQGFMETRIKVLEKMLVNVKMVDESSIDTSKVSIGSTVTLHDIEFAEKVEYTIVGPAESDVMENKISYESPMGKELLGKKVGDTVSVEAPIGTLKYEVLGIRFI